MSTVDDGEAQSKIFRCRPTDVQHTFRSIWYSRETERQSSSERRQNQNGLKLPSNFTEKIIFALPITRLTSIKSLCQDERAAEQFASTSPNSAAAEWGWLSRLSESWRMESSQKLIADAIVLEENTCSDPWREAIYLGLLRQIDRLQGDCIYPGLQCILSAVVICSSWGMRYAALWNIFLTGLINWLESMWNAINLNMAQVWFLNLYQCC